MTRRRATPARGRKRVRPAAFDGRTRAGAARPAAITPLRRASRVAGYLAPLRHSGGVLSAEDGRALGERMHLTPDELMMKLLPLAQRYALPAISGFPVGAVARGPVDAAGWGALYIGGQVEFRGQDLSLVVHAEQSAVNHAWLRGERRLSALAISAVPCGYCRQFLYELRSGGALPLLLAKLDAAPVPLRQLLPVAFGPKDLGRRSGLLDPSCQAPPLERTDASRDPLVEEALAAAGKSYAPYTNGYAGAAIELDDGARFAGRLAENAAYNPSLGPLESAAALARVSRPLDAPLRVRRAVLVEVPSDGGLRRRSEAVLASLAPGVKLEYVTARVARSVTGAAQAIPPER